MVGSQEKAKSEVVVSLDKVKAVGSQEKAKSEVVGTQEKARRLRKPMNTTIINIHVKIEHEKWNDNVP